jgi:protein-tyrosine phosphatase
VGFDHVVATPHIRPSMFDNSPSRLRDAFVALGPRLSREEGLPSVSLAAEHFFDDIVHALLLRGEGLAYGKGRAVLVEFAYERMPVAISARFFDLRMKRLRPVVAHPERYEDFHKDPERASESMRRAGGVLLLDLAAVEGKYGTRAQRTAEELLELDAYYAACSDSHRPEDAEIVGRAISTIERRFGIDIIKRLLQDGPQQILEGRIFDAYD